MFILGCDIQIGAVQFRTVHQVRIKRSLYDLAATATIKIPVTAALKYKGEPPTRIETAQQIKVGDPVTIRLGYNGQLETEFVGYVKRLNYTIPLEIECEDAYFLTRSVNCLFSAKQTTLEACLKAILPGVKLASVVTLTLRNVVINNRPASWVLGWLKKEYGLVAWFDMQGQLYIGRPYDQRGEKVRYCLRYNVIKDDELKFQNAADTRLRVKAICYYKDGSKVEGEIGEQGGEQKTLYFYDVKDAGELKKLAQAELQRYSFDGYRGKITTFLEPYALPGMVAQIEDLVYEERGGNYFIESVDTSFGTGGGRRVLEIGMKA